MNFATLPLLHRGPRLAVLLLGLSASTACVVVPNPDFEQDSQGESTSEVGSTFSDDGGESEVGSENASESSASGTQGDGDGDGDGSSEGDGDGDTGPLACGESRPAGATGCPETCTSCDGDRCLIGCVGEKACEKERIDCPQGWNCEVECDGEQSCKELELHCPDFEACDVTCTGYHSCEQTDVFCGGGVCKTFCGDGGHSCHGLTVSCGSNDSEVTCSDSEQPDLVVDPGPDSDECSCVKAPGCGEGDDDGDDD